MLAGRRRHRLTNLPSDGSDSPQNRMLASPSFAAYGGRNVPSAAAIKPFSRDAPAERVPRIPSHQPQRRSPGTSVHPTGVFRSTPGGPMPRWHSGPTGRSWKPPCPKTRQRRFAGGVSPVEESLWPNTLSPAIVNCPARRRNGRAFGNVRLPTENTRSSQSVNMRFIDGAYPFVHYASSYLSPWSTRRKMGVRNRRLKK
jgi:hypothetical protein